MKVIIAGTKHHTDPRWIEQSVQWSGFDVSEVLVSKQRGLNTAAVNWAKERGIPCKVFEADWDKHGVAAGRLVSAEMASQADAAIGILCGRSPEVHSVLTAARAKCLLTYARHVPVPSWSFEKFEALGLPPEKDKILI